MKQSNPPKPIPKPDRTKIFEGKTPRAPRPPKPPKKK